MDTTIRSLGPARFRSPLHHAGQRGMFRDDSERVIYDHDLNSVLSQVKAGKPLVSFEMAGPREHVFFDPQKTSAGIVTCGPGLNDVIRGIVMELHHRYGVTRIFGFRYGYEGLIPRFGHTPLYLRPESVSTIHTFGGTILGSSRGPQDVKEMVNFLEEMDIDILFVIGGDGTLRGASEICKEIESRNASRSVIGIPKTIDNDIMVIDKSFGFETAFAEAVKAVSCAHTEALGAMNGIGLVKLMGRDSGFISCFTALANNDVNFVLIPEVPFTLEGSSGFLEALYYRISKRKHAVIVVAEGAGQDLLDADPTNTDASGNRKHGDIGGFLRDRIISFFKERKTEVNLKYIDPSYTIRSVPAAPQDNAYCGRLAQNAVHAAMAGKTDMLVGRYHGSYVNLPLSLVTHGRRKVDPKGELWQSVLECTGMPQIFA
jgi:6-phosphofructokinase 1